MTRHVVHVLRCSCGERDLSALQRPGQRRLIQKQWDKNDKALWARQAIRFPLLPLRRPPSALLSVLALSDPHVHLCSSHPETSHPPRVPVVPLITPSRSYVCLPPHPHGTDSRFCSVPPRARRDGTPWVCVWAKPYCHGMAFDS